MAANTWLHEKRVAFCDIVFGIPQVGVKGKDGAYLENHELEPTYRVELDPESAAAGRDTQVIEAVKVLLKTIDNQ